MNVLSAHAAKLRSLSSELQGAGSGVVAAAAEVVRTSIEAQINEDVKRPGHGTGDGRVVTRGNVGVRVDYQGGFGHPAALLRAKGPLHLLNNPTKPHEIRPRPRRGKKALKTPYGPVAKVNHPGNQRPSRTWQKGVDRARPLIGAAMQKSVAALVLRVMR